MDVDGIFRAAAPTPLDDASVRRLAASVLERLERRKRRQRVASWIAGSVAAAIVIGMLTLLHRPASLQPAIQQRRTLAEASAGDVIAPVSRPDDAHIQKIVPRIVSRLVLPRTAGRENESLEAIERRLLGAKSPDEAARLFWKGCERGGVERRMEFLKSMLPAMRPEWLARIAAEIHRRRDVPASFAVELGRSRVAEAWPLLAALFESRGPDPAAIEAAGELGDSRSVPMLRRWIWLADRRAEAAAKALGSIPGRESLRTLLSVFEATRGAGTLLVPDLRKDISEALLRREDEIVEYLFEAKPEARPLVFKALSELRTPGAIAAMIRALDEPALRAEARSYLGRIVKKDLGPRPATWSRWLGETAGTVTGNKENA